MVYGTSSAGQPSDSDEEGLLREKQVADRDSLPAEATITEHRTVSSGYPDLEELWYTKHAIQSATKLLKTVEDALKVLSRNRFYLARLELLGTNHCRSDGNDPATYHKHESMKEHTSCPHSTGVLVRAILCEGPEPEPIAPPKKGWWAWWKRSSPSKDEERLRTRFDSTRQLAQFTRFASLCPTFVDSDEIYTALEDVMVSDNADGKLEVSVKGIPVTPNTWRAAKDFRWTIDTLPDSQAEANGKAKRVYSVWLDACPCVSIDEWWQHECPGRSW